MTQIKVAAVQFALSRECSEAMFYQRVKEIAAAAKSYGVTLVVFPEYLSMQLLASSPVGRPMREHISTLAEMAPDYIAKLATIAKDCGVYLLGGSIPKRNDSREIINVAPLLTPSGASFEQGKLRVTRFEKEEWAMVPDKAVNVFQLGEIKLTISICYDVQFPELQRAAVFAGANLLLVPSWTDDQAGFNRVRQCTRARAIENQIYTLQSPLVGCMPQLEDTALNYGSAGIFSPCDSLFPADGIIRAGVCGLDQFIVADLDFSLLESTREKGTVLTYKTAMLHSADTVPVEHFKL